MAFDRPVLSKRISTNQAARRPVWYQEYVATGGYSALKKVLNGIERGEIIKMVSESGLRGRGGGGTPAGFKLGAMPTAKQGTHYLVINADEAEPGTFKDRFIIDHDPHQLLEGIVIAALATQADVAYIYIRGEYHRQAKVLARAIQEAYDNGIFGPQGVFGSREIGYPIECYIHRGAGAYICGEETALLESIEGKRGWPRNKPPFPAVYGAFGQPTSVFNVETLCCIPHIVEHGAAWFRSMGTAKSPGPKLFGMSGHVNRPGVYEAELGITLDYAINTLGGGMKGGEYKACICGGISMGVLGTDQLDIHLDFEDPRMRGGCLGIGTAGMIVMNGHANMVAALRNCLRFYAHESCGQCTPCREGTAWMAKIVDRIHAGDGQVKDLEMLLELEKTMGAMPGTTICGLADAASWPVRTFINKFYGEFEAACRGTARSSFRHANVVTPMGSNTRTSSLSLYPAAV